MRVSAHGISSVYVVGEFFFFCGYFGCLCFCVSFAVGAVWREVVFFFSFGGSMGALLLFFFSGATNRMTVARYETALQPRHDSDYRASTS